MPGTVVAFGVNQIPYREEERSLLAWLRNEASWESWYHSLVLELNTIGSNGGGHSGRGEQHEQRPGSRKAKKCVGGTLKGPQRLKHQGDKIGKWAEARYLLDHKM